MSESSETNVRDFVGELGAGTLERQLAALLSEAALNTCLFGNGKKTAKVNLSLTMKQVGENQQVQISHKLAKDVPTNTGKKTEELTSQTVFFVGKGGKLSMSQPKEDDNGQFSLSQVQ